MAAKGMFIQQVFPMGAFGPGQWSFTEMRRLFRWLKELGYDRTGFTAWPIHLREDAEHTILEYGALYHSALSSHPPFDPGDAYCPSDRYLGSPEGLARAKRFRDQLRISREEGLTPWLMVGMSIGAPQFAQEHPELAPVDGSETFLEGTALCPSKPEALEHLLEFHSRQVEYFDAAEAFILMPRDPGGCSCEKCTPQGQMLSRIANSYYGMIRRVRPEAPITFLSWHINIPDVADLATNLPSDMPIFESPRIHAMDVPIEQFAKRVRAWEENGRRVSGWIEVQENPTSLLPTIYPKRLAGMVSLMRELGLDDTWGTSTQNPYLFPLNFWLLPKLWDKETDLNDLLLEFLSESYGTSCVESGMRYLDITERAWDKIQSKSQWDAGFVGLFVVTFPQRLLPEQCIKYGVPEHTREDVEQAAVLSREALHAAEEFADSLRLFHALDANIIAVSAEVFAHRVEMRRAKLDVLDTLHHGDAERAVRAWSAVQKACDDMVAAAHSAPNTDVLAKHWRRLDLLPARLRTLAQHLPELAECREFRSIRQPLYMREKYGLTEEK